MTLLIMFIFLNILTHLSSFDMYSEVFEEMEAVSGHQTELPCKTKYWSKKRLALVFWYKGLSEVPIYTLDVRESSLAKPKHIFADAFKNKLNFNTSKNPPTLMIKNLTKDDQGEYRCRVDYKKSRTENHFINLTVIVAPESVVIKDKDGHKLSGVIGPFKPYTNVVLICETKGVVPVDVKIEKSDVPFSADRLTEVRCKSSSSHPSAQLTWWIDEIKLTNVNVSVKNDGNTTQSVLWFTPSIDDNGKYLICRSCNTRENNSYLEDRMLLNIYFKPQSKLSLGASLDATNIKEGSDVYFECKIHANPGVFDVTWLFEDEILLSHVETGIIVSNQSLVLQKIRRQNSGRYKCKATNKEGSSISNEVYLQIKYTPTCKQGQTWTYGVARNELVHITCEVEANPANVTFKWIFTNSQNLTSLINYVTNGTISRVDYSPRNRFEYGSILCLAENEMGIQQKACVYNIMAEGPPEAIKSCSFFNQTNQSILIKCKAEDNGRQKQIYFIEVYDSVYQLITNQTSSEEPLFLISNLVPATTYLFNVYAANHKGRSEMFRITAQTPQNPQKQTVNIKTQNSKSIIINLLMPLLIIILILITIIVLTVILTRGWRKRNNQVESEMDKISNLDNTLSAFKESELDEGAKAINLMKFETHPLEESELEHGFSSLYMLKENWICPTKVENDSSTSLVWPSDYYQIGYITEASQNLNRMNEEISCQGYQLNGINMTQESFYKK